MTVSTPPVAEVEERHTRRRFLQGAASTLPLLTGASALAACGGGGSGTTSSGPVTLTFWHTFSTAEANLLQRLMRAYTHANPRVHVNVVSIPYSQRPTKIPTALQTGSLPDLIRADYPFQWYLSRANALVPLDDKLKGWEMRDAIDPIAWDDVTWNGQIMGIPQARFSNMPVYNVNRFAAIGLSGFPKTWDELRSACKELTGNGRYACAFEFAEDISWDLIPLIKQAGGEAFDKDGNPTMDSDQGVAALEFLLELTQYMPRGVANFTYDDVDAALKNQSIAWYGAGSWVLSDYATAKVPFKIALGTWPAGPGGPGSLTNHTFYLVTRASKHADDAVALAKFLTNRRNALMWAKALQEEPVDRYTRENAFFQKPVFSAYADTGRISTLYPKTPVWLSIDDAFTKYVQKAVLRQLPAREAMKQLAAACESIIKKKS
jgi:ABC-type glycerol-3-phosphate transport system substrate-binding protein